MKTIVCLILLLAAGTALSEEFSAERKTGEEACTYVLDEARKAGFEISKFDCYCDYKPEVKKHACTVDSTGAKRIQAAGKPTPPAQASRQPATPGQAAKNPTRPGPAQCAAMAKHNDTKLKADMQRAQKSIDAAKDSLALIAEVREVATGLQENQKLANNAYKVTLVTKLTNDLIADILKSYPPTSKAMKEAEEAASIAQRVILTTAKAASYAESPVQYKAKELARKVPVAGDIVVGAFNLGKNIQNLKEASEEGDEIIDVTDEGLKGQQRLIGKLKTRLDTSTFRLEMLKKLGSEIDKVCS